MIATSTLDHEMQVTSCCRTAHLRGHAELITCGGRGVVATCADTAIVAGPIEQSLVRKQHLLSICQTAQLRERHTT